MRAYTVLIALLLAAPAAYADGSPSARDLPETLGVPGPEVCTIEIGDDAFDAELTCDGLQSCQTDKSLWKDLATECLGIPGDSSLGDAQKAANPPKKAPPKRKPPKRKPPQKAPPKKDPPKSEPGKPGADGYSTLMRVNEEPKGKVCPAGGYRIHLGLDKDRDGALSDKEARTAFPVCHGRDGKDGVTKTIVKHVYEKLPEIRQPKDGKDGKDGTRVNLGVGVLSTALFSKGNPDAYAFGPSLQLQIGLSERTELTLEGAWAPRRDRGAMLRLGVARYLKSWLYVEAGPMAQWIGLDGNYAKAQFVGLTAGPGVRLTKGSVSLRVSVSGFAGVEGFNLDDDATFAYGGAANGALTWQW